MKTKKEILEDVISLIEKQGGRAVQGQFNSCTYLANDGKICGHSMALRDELRKNYKGSASNVIEELGGDTCHKPEYQGHSIQFWEDVQSFHDMLDNFKDNKITEQGREVMNKILKDYV